MARYTAAHAGKVEAVFVNGQRAKDCLEADDEHGFAICYVRDEHGKPVLDGDRIKTEVLTGKVQVSLYKKEG